MDRGGLTAAIRRVGAAVTEKHLVVGTVHLSQQGIKEQTLGVDLVVERGNMPKIMETFEKTGMGEPVVYGFGAVVPGDYVKQADDCGMYGYTTVKAMDLIDDITTMAGRYCQRDKGDVAMCGRNGVAPDAVLRGLCDYSIERNERGSIRKGLAEVFGASPQDVGDAL